MNSLDRTTPPPFQQTLEFNLPICERISSEGQPEAWYVPSDNHDVVQVDVIYDAGKTHEFIPGIGQFTIQMLNKGAGGKKSEEIANTLNYYGAHYAANSGFDFSSLTLSTLSKHLKKLLPLLRLMIESPDFPVEELELFRKIYIENLKVNLEKNDYLASNYVRKKIYGQHPYGVSVGIEDARLISKENILSFYRNHLQPFKIFIVGKIEPDDLNFLSKEIRLTQPATNHQEKINSSMPSKEILDGPNKTQASIKLGQLTVSRTHPDYPLVQMANHLLGGFFGSRLMKNIREEKGLTYGIYSSLKSYLRATVMIISAEVNTDKHEYALEEILKEVDSIKSVSHDELTIARNHLIGSLQNDVSTVFAAAERIKNIKLYGLPENYYQDLIKEVSGINTENIKEIAFKYFEPTQLSTVVVR